MTYTLNINSLYILESLPDSDSKTGLWQYNNLVNLSNQHPFFKIQHTQLQSKDDFFRQLHKIKYEVQNENRLPIIHIEAHGDPEGLEIAQSKESISWKELTILLSEINFATNNNLVLTMAVCKGNYIDLELMDIFSEKRRSPYFVNISSQNNLHPSNIKEGFSSFFWRLFENVDFNMAVEDMREELNSIIVSLPYQFIIDNLLNKLMRTDPGTEIGQKKRKEIQMLWEHFLMIDSHPENQEKFPTIDDIY